MYNILLGVYLLISVGLVALVLIQQGKGADMGASFGSGASNTVFGSSGSGNFLTRSTGVLATLFFVISLALGHLSSPSTSSANQWQNLGKTAQKVSQPVTQSATPKAPAGSSSSSSKTVINQVPK